MGRLFLLLFCLLALVPCQSNAAMLAHIETNYGTITATLNYQASPKAVANFIRLAEGDAAYVDPNDGEVRSKRFYDGTTFHRVIRNVFIQGGCPIGDGSGGPGWTFPDETDNGLTHQLYSLSMSNSGPNTNGSQFFIVSRNISVAQAAQFNGRNTVFGQVTAASRPVVDFIENVQVGPGNEGENTRPVEPVTIISVEIERTDAPARAFNQFGQQLPNGIFPVGTTFKMGEVDEQVEIEVDQASHTELLVYRSLDLKSWEFFAKRYLPADVSARSQVSFERPEDDTSFFRIAQVAYHPDATSPSDLSDKQITIQARSPINANAISFYDFIFDSDGSGSWRARNSFNQQISSGILTSSNPAVTPHGGVLTLTGNLPYANTWSIAYTLDSDLQTASKWEGTQLVTYGTLGDEVRLFPIEIFTIPP